MGAAFAFQSAGTCGPRGVARAHELYDTSYADPGTGPARLVIRAEAVNRSNPRHRMAGALGWNIRAASVELTPHDLRGIEAHGPVIPKSWRR